MGFWEMRVKATLDRCTNLQMEGGYDRIGHSFPVKLICKGCSRNITIEFQTKLGPNYNPIISTLSFDHSLTNNEKAILRRFLVEDRSAHSPDIMCEGCGKYIWIMIYSYGAPLQAAGPAEVDEAGQSEGRMYVLYIQGAEPVTHFKLAGSWEVQRIVDGEFCYNIDLWNGYAEEVDITESDILVMQNSRLFARNYNPNSWMIQGAHGYFKPYNNN